LPLDRYPRLVHGTAEERKNWRLIGRGQGIHWDDLDEDISVEGVAGRPILRREPVLFAALARRSAGEGILAEIGKWARKTCPPLRRVNIPQIANFAHFFIKFCISYN
jgi:hypothetical protein